MQFWAEGFGALAVIFNFIGYRQNTVERYLMVSAVALFCVSIHFFMLDAMAAGIGCLLASIRNVVALKNRGKGVLIGFVAANLAFLAYEWFILNHGWLIFFAYSSALIFTIGSIVLRDATRIRQWFILAEILGLIYAVAVGSIFGTIFNITNLTSIITKLVQDRKLKQAS
ncbi:YgjV family protein [Alteromonas ponticola]|uniref:YgjV family protein n=1 Tax=Alteromonas aquimaris TaxID=2998417 RepID=A0ABT3PA49_9ALTE|nr:YgjV family protein [Alteromonas aquimaris]MCW8109656.1 YgjV family protein [Alteromonas aquimaris]